MCVLLEVVAEGLPTVALMTTRYDWTQAPEGAIAGVRDCRMGTGLGFWVGINSDGPGGFSGLWPSRKISFQAMHPSAILDASGPWQDSLELRPRETDAQDNVWDIY